GDMILEGSSRYLNFGTATSSNGYGFRDNAGMMEFRNSSGVWNSVSQIISGPAFSVNKNGTNQTVSISTDVKLTWSTEAFDTYNNFASDRFTPTVTGKYMIDGSVGCSTAATNCRVGIYKNGTPYAYGNQVGGTASGARSTVSTLIEMNGSSDYLELYVYSDNATIIGGATSTYFTGTLIAPLSSVALASTANATTSTSSASGLQVFSDGSLSLLRGCSNGQVLRWATSTSKWECNYGSDEQITIKTVDELVTSSTVLQNDDELFFSVGANQTWVFKFELIYRNNGNNTPDFLMDILGNSGWTCSYALLMPSTNLANVGSDCDNAPTAIDIQPAADGGNPGRIIVQGRITTTSAGTVQLRWAQRASSVNPVTIFQGSVVNAQRVGGVDLAEMYYTLDPSLLSGDVVSLDGSIEAGVQKSTKAYDKNAIGIVTTKPGIILGDGSDSSPDSVPVLIALTGRVPVNVSNENGPIVVGDLLTSSSIPGVAMRATKAGQVIGQAMSPFNGTSTGQVLVFIKNSHYNGTNAEDYMANDVNATTTASTTLPLAKNVLMRFLDQVSFLSSLSSISEIITDRLSAALEVITPKIVTGEISTNKLTTSTGNDLNVELASGERFVIQSMIPASGDGLIATSTTEMMSFDALGNAVINNGLNVGSIESANEILAHGNLSVEGKATFSTEGFQSNGDSIVSGNFTVGTTSDELLLADTINSRINIGTTTGNATLFVQAKSNINPFIVASSTGAAILSVLSNGSVAIGSTSTEATLSIKSQNNTINPFEITSFNNSKLFTVTSNGFVGFGTSSPIARADVWGNFNVATGSVSTFFVNTGTGVVGIGNNAIAIDGELLRVSGRIRATGFDVDSAADLAENFPASEAVDAGTVIAFSTSTIAWNTHGSTTTENTYNMSTVRKALSGYEAVGVVSTNSGIVLGGKVTNGVPVAFSGRVPVKVTTENGEIKQGDYLTVSKTMPGYAMKLIGEGRSIGRALSDYETGRDKVLMFVENGNQKLDLAGRNGTTTGMLTVGNVDLNANGVAITNIKSLASANGTWSIDENGRIVGKVICLEDVCIDKTTLTNMLNYSNQPAVLGVSTTTVSTSTSTSTTSTSTTSTSTTTSTTTPEIPTSSDTIAPVISIIGNTSISINVGTSYSDEGATATDDVDGDLTASIVTVSTVNIGTAGSYNVNYTVTDAAGNETTVTRIVEVVDPIPPVDSVPPVITLNGSQTVSITVGGQYTEDGATATDDVDGDITSLIVQTGIVDTNTAGSYSINYSVTDEAGNQTTISRTVNVTEVLP
ncbi:DUF5011 domain-containing protein, partial [Candidatus Gracilibacteria bacterium]|nr:DUF5011 domain-containing protein [Candidatus Gracilibacteria bacterium]